MTTTTEPLPLLIDTVRVEQVTRLSPGFVRVALSGPHLGDLGCEGPMYDQRIKLVVPEAEGARNGPAPSFEGADDSWYTTWLARPPAERGHMRTYTVRRVVGEGADTRLLVDVVLHDDDGEHRAGPGSRWAARAAVGDEVVLIGPRRGVPYGGIEWAPGEADHVLLVGDETALPAIAGVLEGLVETGSTLPGRAFVEVPSAADVQDLVGPPGLEVSWVVRDGARHGERLHAAVVEHLGDGSTRVEVSDDEVDPDLWETPAWSSSGETAGEPGAVAPAARVAHDLQDLDGLYAWIAGESRMVTGLRRVLVKELGVDRRQVAFMGYWRLGVAMQS